MLQELRIIGKLLALSVSYYIVCLIVFVTNFVRCYYFIIISIVHFFLFFISFCFYHVRPQIKARDIKCPPPVWKWNLRAVI